MVTAPVAMAFDENGRLFVVERPAHSASLAGRIRVLESFDDEGKVKTSRVYATDLAGASAVACYAGGVFVAAGHDILYLKNSHNDEGADIRQVVFTGIGGTNALNARALVNNLNWGLENRFYGASGQAGGLLSAASWPGGPVALEGCDFSFDPRSLAVTAETGPAQSGLSFDSVGRRFLCDYDHPLKLAMYEQRYVERNPFCARADGTIDVASPATTVFMPAQLGGQAQTNMALRRLSPTWLSDANSCMIYRGELFPTNYYGNAFIASPAEHLLYRALLRDNGFGIMAERPPEARGREFLASTDSTFHPVQIITGPEGALYIADYQDGQEHGRIYRVVPASFKPAASPQLGRASTRQLVQALASPNAWHCDTAARLLYERRDPEAVSLLMDMATHAGSVLARLRSLYALSGVGTLRQPQVLAALADNDPIIREHAVQLAETVLTNRVPSEPLWTKLKTLAADPVLRVRYQLAFSLGEMRHRERARLLADILRRDPANPWIQAAVLSSCGEGGGELFVLLGNDQGFLSQASGHTFLLQLASMLGTQGRLTEVVQALSFISQGQLAHLQTFSFLGAIGEGLYRTRSGLTLVDPTGVLVPWYAQARDAMVAGNLLPDPTRVAAIRLLSFSTFTYDDVASWLMLLCDPQVRPALVAAAVSTLCRYDDPRAVNNLLGQWPNIPPLERTQAIDAWLSRTSHVPALMDALANKRLGTNDFSPTQQNFLRTYPDDSVQQQALRSFGPLRLRRPEVVEYFRPALRLIGIPDAGRATFLARCAVCHRLGTTGQAFGPDLTGGRSKGKAELLRKILEPNGDITPQYATWVLESKEGDNVMGLQGPENAVAVRVRQAGVGQAIWPRDDILAVHPQTWSLMPEGLEAGLSLQNMADLLEYLMTAPPR